MVSALLDSKTSSNDEKGECVGNVMKKSCGILSGLLLIVFCTPLGADVRFLSNNAAISVGPGARLVIDSAALSVDGTIIKDAAASISGNPIYFNHGILTSDGVDVILTASFFPGGSNYITLGGNGRFDASPGVVVQAINVSGQDNRIEGQPALQNPVTLQDADTAVTLALHNTLNQNVALNGGAVTLASDLSLADDVKLVGDGTLTLNGHRLTLGGYYSSPWSGSLSFNNATDIALTGNVALNGTWLFEGNNVLHGNGSILDLSGGGKIELAAGAVLSMNDLTLTGVGTGYGSVTFDAASSQLRTNDVTLRLAADTRIQRGTFYVQGPTTFITSDKTLLFNTTGKLTVNGTTLWLDSLSNRSLTGGLYAPLALYGASGLSSNNIASNVASGNLSLLNNGTVRIVSQSDIGTNPLSGTITTTVSLGWDIFLRPEDYIRIDKNVTIDGKGSAIYFSSPTSPVHSQLIIAPGKILTLKNVSLLNLSANTFDMRSDAQMHIGQKVQFELSQDITFSTGVVKLIGSGLSSDIFEVTGKNGRYKMAIAPLDPTDSYFDYSLGRYVETIRKTLQLGTNTLTLENIELSGLDYISHTNGVLVGAVALSHNARALLSNDTDMNFFVQGADNELVVQKDGVNFSGNITFGNQADNTLHIRTALESGLNSQVETAVGAQTGNPVIKFSGDPGIYLSSADGQARLFFDDPSISVVSAGQNSIIIDAHSYLGCRNLELLDNPIKQYSALFNFNAVQFSGIQIDPSFIRLPSSLRQSLFVLPTALHFKQQQERRAFESGKQEFLKLKKKDQASVKPVRPKDGKQKQQTRGVELDEDRENALTRLPVAPKNGIVRLSLAPVAFDQRYLNMTFACSSFLSGNLEFDASVIRNAAVSDTSPFNIVLKNGTILDQGSADMLFSQGQYCSIVGVHNVINVTKAMVIGNNFFFEHGAELTFNFVNTGQGVPSVTFAAGTSLELVEQSVLRFSGHGDVIFQDGVTFQFSGSKDAENNVEGRPRFILTDGAVMSLAQDARVVMQGIGRIEIAQRGGLSMTSVAALIIGGDDVFVEQSSDFELNVAGAGFITLAPTTIPSLSDDLIETSGVARLSFQRTTAAITIENGGMLLVANGGRFEINAEGDALKRGKLTTLNMHNNCLINLRGTGRFVLGSNGSHSALATPLMFAWDGLLANFSGDGAVRYIDQDANKGFTGKLSLQANVLTTDSSITSERLVNLFVQEVSALSVSSVYTDLEGNRKLRTVKGVVVALQDGDVVVSDDGTITSVTYGYVDGYDYAGYAFRYTPDGIRL